MGPPDADRASRRRFGCPPDALLDAFGLQINIQTQEPQTICEQEHSRRDQNRLGKLAHVGKLIDQI